jgi:hypothetical protein
MREPGSRKIALLPIPFLLDSPRGRRRDRAEDHQKVMMTRTRTRQPFTRASIMAGSGLAVLVVATPAPAYVVEAITAIWADEGNDRTGLENVIQAAMDGVAAHAAALTPTVVALLDARLIGDRILLFVLLADREGERAVKVLLEERSAREWAPGVSGGGRPFVGPHQRDKENTTHDPRRGSPRAARRSRHATHPERARQPDRRLGA